MPFSRPIAVVLGLLLLASLPALAQQAQPLFSHPVISKDAERYESYLKGAFKPGRQTARQQREAGLKVLADGGDARVAARHLATAVVTDAKDAAAWTGLARALLAMTPDPARPGERYSIPVNASGAAYRALEHAKTDRQRAEALAVLGEALKARSMWRPAIEALASSVRLVDAEEVRDKLEALRAEHGFRVIDYKTESDAVEPRLCINFSERLPSAVGDLQKFVAVDGREPQNMTVEGQQLCIDGLEHGKRYEIQLRAGLPSTVGETLPKASEIAVYVRDRAPSVRFTGRAYVLPRRGQQGIPVVSVNTNKAAIEILRIGDRALAGATSLDGFLKQVQSYELETIRERSGQRVWQGELEIAGRLNEDVTTAIPVSEAVPDLAPGVYLVIASAADGKRNEYQAPATQWFIVSDLGLTALSGDDGLHAFVRALGAATPVADVAVRLVARNNEVLATGRTDARGYARFDAALMRGTGGLAPALLVAEGNRDYAFLDLATAAFDLTDRGVKGREPPGPLDGYVYADRGVYRPGEPVHLVALLRDRAGAASNAPATLIVTRPDGVEHRRIVLNDPQLGGRAATLALPPTAMTGTWRARLFIDVKSRALAQTSFLVEDFIPERLALTLEPQSRAIAIEETASIAVIGRYLYGPPAAGLAIEGDIHVRPATADLPGLAGYKFGLAGEQVMPVRQPLENLPSTDADGRGLIGVRLPPVPKTAKPLEAEIIVRLREPSGRTIERSVRLPIDTRMARVGIKPLFTGSQIGEGETARFETVLVDSDGKPRAGAALKWEIVQLNQRWQWYSRDGQWNYEAITTTKRIANGTVKADGTSPARIEAPVLDWGRYRLEVTSADPKAPGAASIAFNVGWHASEDAESPEVLDVVLDKPTYKAGDTARVRLNTRAAGKVRLAVLSNGLLAMQDADIPASGGEIALPVEASWMPGAYVTAMFYRAMDEGAKRMPSRAIGVRWLGLDTTGETLKLTLGAPAKVKPSSTLTVPVKIDGLMPGEAARLTLAAVDIGILNLTRFEAPAPDRHFHAQRRLGVEIRDFYGRLIDGMRATRGTLRSGGDEDGGGMSMRGSPPVEKPLALFSGIVEVKADGTADVKFDLPDFNGTVRLMAVAWSAGKVGSAGSDVLVRDVLALTATAPRFLSLGDEASIAIDVHNIEGPDAAYVIGAEQENPQGLVISLAQRSPRLAPNQRRSERVAIRPASLGRHVYSVRVSGPDGIEVRRRVALEVMPPANDIRRTVVASLAAKGGRLNLSPDLLADLIPSTARIALNIGPSAGMDVPGLLASLDRYPYGCAEQTTSRALPLLYVNDVARRIGLAEESQLRERVDKAIARVLEMQDASGAFGVWGPGEPDLWLTGYVSDFLTRAKELGYAVPERALTQALDRLANFISYAQDFEKGGEARAYALYVLARNGRAPVGELRYYADTRLERFSTALAQAHIGAALAMTGDKPRAERALRAALARMGDDTAEESRADYGSRLRDGAAVLTLVSETRTLVSEAPLLARIIERAQAARTYTSTQEQAWMLLAARALSDAAAGTRLTVNGAPHSGELTRALAASDLGPGGLAIVNSGEVPVSAVVSVTGSALTAEPAVSKGFTISRSYHTLDGTPIVPANAQLSVKQNDRVVVVLKIEGQHTGGRVLLVDRLPAGFEIENPRLVDSGDTKSLAWVPSAGKPTHTEFRDDRFVAAFDYFEGEDRRSGTQPVAAVAYIVRAVTPGRFVHPAASVEDMYRPDHHARTSAGTLLVTAAQ
ncbi:MAG: alpha-2-macroglobulin family protein [Hyphomicrobiaceae bacterium]